MRRLSIVLALLMVSFMIPRAALASKPNVGMSDANATQGAGTSGDNDGSGSDTVWVSCYMADGPEIIDNRPPCIGYYPGCDIDNIYFPLNPVTGQPDRSRWACFDQPPAGPSAGMILRAFKSYKWPSASMRTSPHKGVVAINRKSILYTDLAGPKTTTVTLLGVAVTIEATPSRYLWHADQGGSSWQTTSPGRPYTGGSATDAGYIWVIYDVPKVTVEPSVDVVYSGRFRIGGGAWTTIPETLTVTGAPTPLRTTSAQGIIIDN